MIREPGTRIRLTGSQWPPPMKARIYSPVAWETDYTYIMYHGSEIALHCTNQHSDAFGFEFIDPPVYDPNYNP